MATQAEFVDFDDARDIDPGTFSVIMGMYENIGREMMITLERSAWTSIINLCRDFSVGIADGDCNLVGVPDTALPCQAMTLQRIMKSTADFFEDEIYDGDVLMCNLAYLGNTHMGEPLLASPVFHDGKIMFWSMARGHLARVWRKAMTGDPSIKDDDEIVSTVARAIWDKDPGHRINQAEFVRPERIMSQIGG